MIAPARSDPGGRFAAEPRLEFVRPGPSALEWLDAVVAGLKSGDPFRPVSVVVPNDYAGRVVRWHFGHRGGLLNLTTPRLRHLTELIARPLFGSSSKPLSRVLEGSAIREALRRNASAFSGVADASLLAELVALVRELRRAEVEPAELGVPAAARATRGAGAVYETFRHLTRGYRTPTDAANVAARFLRRVNRCPPALERLGAIVVYLPTRVDVAEAHFLAATARWLPLLVAFIGTSDPRGLGDNPSSEAARTIARALNLPPPASPRPTTIFLPPDATRILRAPDPTEEVREVLRRVAADLESGIALHRVGIVYRQSDPYGPLVRDALDAAGLPWVSSEGVRLADSRPGRALLGLLQLSDRDFTRSAVLEWLDLLPPGLGPGDDLSVAACDRLTRAANVVRRVDQWRERLTAFADALDVQAANLVREDDASPLAEGYRRQSMEARALALFVGNLAEGLRSPPGGSSWESFVTWASDLRDRLVGPAILWPASQREAFDMVSQTLDSLKYADRLEGDTGTDLATFVATLADALSERRLATGQFGSGVAVEPLPAVTGLTFDRLYVLGMREGAFPPPPAIDSFFPPGSLDPLGRRERQRGQERRDYLVALASADRGAITLSVADSDGEREATPSSWLLEVASQLESGHDLDSTDFARLDPTPRPWLTAIRSAVDSVGRASVYVDLEDRRLAEVARWRADGRALSDHPLARREELPLAPALKLSDARRSWRLTEYDGNLSRRSKRSRVARALGSAGWPISATAIEMWFSCGFRYFLTRVLRVEPTPEPEEIWSLRPVDRGSLVHQVLARYGAAARSRERLADKRALLAEILAGETTALEASGLTGHPLDWENARRMLVADLSTFVAFDERWRHNEGLTPLLFEQPFGTNDAGAWPAVPVLTATGTLWFRGVIDRVDVAPDGGRAVVFDYKTGSARGYAKLADDPLAEGEHVQIALYREAAQRNLAPTGGVTGAYWFVSAKGGFELIPVVHSDADIADRLREVVGAAARGILAGSFPQVSGEWNDGGFARCRYCAFDRVCPSHRDQIWELKRLDDIAKLHAAPGPNGSNDGTADDVLDESESR